MRALIALEGRSACYLPAAGRYRQAAGKPQPPCADDGRTAPSWLRPALP